MLKWCDDYVECLIIIIGPTTYNSEQKQPKKTFSFTYGLWCMVYGVLYGSCGWWRKKIHNLNRHVWVFVQAFRKTRNKFKEHRQPLHTNIQVVVIIRKRGFLQCSSLISTWHPHFLSLFIIIWHALVHCLQTYIRLKIDAIQAK